MIEQINQTEKDNSSIVLEEEKQQQVIATIIDLTFYELWNKSVVELQSLFEKNRTFWGQAPLIIRFANFLFTEEQAAELRTLIAQFRLNVISLQTNSVRSWKYLRAKGFDVMAISGEENKEENNISKSNVKVSHQRLSNFRESFKNATKKTEDPIITAEFFNLSPAVSANTKNTLPHNSIEINTAYIHSEDNIALRSGQKVVYEGNLIIFGDTNPGCQIFATGSIIVYGKLCGNVHAGWNVTDETQISSIYIKALLMGDPLQVNIGKYSACSSDEQKKFVKKHKIYPETARVVDNQIWRFPDFT